MNGIFPDCGGRTKISEGLVGVSREAAGPRTDTIFFLYAEAGDCLGSLSVTSSLPVTRMAEVYP